MTPDPQLPERTHDGCLGPDCPICRSPSRYPGVEWDPPFGQPAKVRQPELREAIQ